MAKPLFLREVAATSAIALATKITAGALGIVTQIILARHYGSELMGTFFIASNLVLMGGVICTLGLDFGMLRFAALLQEKGQRQAIRALLRRSMAVVLGLGVLAGAILLAGQSWLSRYLHASALPSMILLFALALPLMTVANLLRETLRGLGAVLWVTVTQNVVQPGALLVLMLLFAVWRPWEMEPGRALSWAFWGSSAMALSVFGWRLAQQAFPREPGPQKAEWRNLYRYSFPLFLIVTLNLGLSSVDCLILALFRSPQEVAYYGVALKIASLIVLPLVAVNAVVPALIVQYHQRSQLVEMEILARTMARWTYYLSLPLCLFFILVSSDLLGFFGPGFPAAQGALAILALGQLVNVSVGSVFALLNLTAHQNAALKIQWGALCFSLPLMVGLTYRYGIFGTALGNALGLALINLWGVWAVWKTIGIKSFISRVTLLTLVTLAAFLISWLVRLQWGTIWAAINFTLIYLGIFSYTVWRLDEWRSFRVISAH